MRRLPTLIVLAKAPRMGRVKTRLARAVGQAEAVRFHRAALGRTLRVLGRDPRWHRVLALSPDRAGFRPPPGWTVRPQGGGGLGERMLRHLAQAGGPAVLVGSDIPAVSAAAVARAFAVLRRRPAVFGPAEDGGYWLIGTARPPRDLRALDGVRWSGPHALADSLAALGLEAGQVDTLWDVDDAASLRRALRR